MKVCLFSIMMHICSAKCGMHHANRVSTLDWADNESALVCFCLTASVYPDDRRAWCIYSTVLC